MKIVVQFCIDADIIECPVDITDNLMDYRYKFLIWLSDKQNLHSYWVHKDGELYGLCYRSEAFVEWLNHFVLHDSISKAKVLESSIISWDKNLTSICF